MCVCVLQQTFLGATELDDELIKQLPKEVLLRVFSYLDVVSLCRCAQVGVTPPPFPTPTPPPPVACNNSTLSIKINESFSLQVCKYWNVLALDGSSWQKINLFDFQRDIEVRVPTNLLYLILL